jgi:hypothetical protein
MAGKATSLKTRIRIRFNVSERRLCSKIVRRDVRRRHRGQRPTATEIRIRNHQTGGQAATVAGYAGPGFHTWPKGHIPQNTDPNPLQRRRASASAQKSFGKSFGEARVRPRAFFPQKLKELCSGSCPKPSGTSNTYSVHPSRV